MKNVMTKEELLSVPKRKWDKELTDVRAIYIISSNQIHDSGYQCMDMVAIIGENLDEYVGFGCDTDSLHISKIEDIGIDVHPNNGCIRLFARQPRTFRIWSGDYSDVFVEAE